MRVRRLRVAVLGSAVELAAPEPVADLLGELLAGFAPTEAPAAVLSVTADDDGWTVRQGVVAVAEGLASDQEAVMAALQQLNLFVLESAPVPTVHAAVLALPDGRVVALPALSGTGKSTMAAALLAAGAALVSDEALVVDGEGAVTPYPRPLALSLERAEALGLPAGTVTAFGEVAYAPGVLGPLAAAPLTLTDVVRLHRRPGPAVLTALPAVEIAPLLLANCFNHYRDPARAFSVAAQVARRCQGWELGYDEAPEGAAALLGGPAG